MVPIDWSNSDSAPGPEDLNLRDLLQQQANVQLGEVHDKSIIEWIQLSHEYLRDFEEALLRNDQVHAYARFVVATRICYTLIPAHPNYASLSKSEKMRDDLLRQKILDNFPEFMSLTVPSIIDRETRYLGVASLSSRRADRLTPPASPASSTVASVENDHQSVISSDTFMQQYRNDQQSIISADTFVPQQRSNATEQPFATDWEGGANETRQQPPEDSPHRYNLQNRHFNEHIIPVEDRVIIEDSSVIALGANLFEDLGPGTSLNNNQTSSSEAPRMDTSHESVNPRVCHGRHQSASDTMAELYQKINEMKNSYSKNHDSSSISSDDDVDQEPANNTESSNLFVSNDNIPFPRVGFRDRDTTDIVSPTMNNTSRDPYLAQNQARLSDDKIPTMITTTSSSPNSEIFPMDSISRASSISQRGGLVASHEEHLATDFEHLRLTNSNSSHVLQPVEPITLTPQLEDDTINKPDENDGSWTTETTTTQKPDDALASNIPTVAAAAPLTHSDSFDSTHTARRKSFVDGFWGSKHHKADTSRKKITVQQPPPSNYVHGSSVFRPFGSIMSSGKSKGKAKKDSKNVSRKESKILQPTIHQVESEHATEQVENHYTSQPLDKTFERKNRDSISDDDVLVSDTDDRIAFSPAHRPSNSSDLPAGSSSVHESSSSHPIPIASQPPSTMENIPAYVSQGEGIYSTSPASYTGSSRPHSSPQNNTLVDFQAPVISPTVHPLINRLQRYAHTSLECVRYMDFPSLISYATDLFASMRQLESERDYEDAYVQGYMGIIVVTDVLRKHSDRRRDKGKDFYRFIEIYELVNYRYKSKLNNIQNILENTHPSP